MKLLILKENKDKSGIYKWTHLKTKNFYIGSSINLWRRFLNYYNFSYISKNNLIISRALVKYGYLNFSLEILEYCDKSNLLEREQYYLDLLKPTYNILKLAGSSIGFKHSENTKIKISKSLKGVYIGERSSLFGRTHTEETKKLMSQTKIGINNPLYGKTHTEYTKILMKKAKLGKVHTEKTKKNISRKKGSIVYLYKEDFYTKQLSYIRSFFSIRETAKFFNVSHNTISINIKSRNLFKNEYKFFFIPPLQSNN